jgi:hypothetical protein
MQASISSLEGTLHEEQRSVSNLRSALHLAKNATGGAPADTAALARDAMLRDEVRLTSMLLHEEHRACPKCCTE